MASNSPSPVIVVSRDPGRRSTFAVAVRDSRGESRHRVTVSDKDAARLAKLGADPAAGVRAAMLFLLDREPKESILGTFDIDVIRRYFPEFDAAFPAYLQRLSEEPGRDA
jgi:hypothetical protein